MNKTDKERSVGWQFGIRHAMAGTIVFALLSFVAMPRYPSAPTIPVQSASYQLEANNIESAAYYRDHNFAYLTTKVRIPIEGNHSAKLVRISDPESAFASELKAAGVPYSIRGKPPTFWILCFGTAFIAIIAFISLAIIRYRRNHADHRHASLSNSEQ